MGGTNVVSFLHVIQSDFARLESETTAAESEAVRTFDEFTGKAEMTRAANTQKSSLPSTWLTEMWKNWRCSKSSRTTTKMVDATEETYLQPSTTCKTQLAVLIVTQTIPRRAPHRGGPTNASGMEAKLAFMNSGCSLVLTLGSIWGAYSVDANEGSHCAAVIQRPLSVCVDAEERFLVYSSGIFDGCGKSTDHAILFVCYGYYNSNPYWKVKNSWGAFWDLIGDVLISRPLGSGAAWNPI